MSRISFSKFKFFFQEIQDNKAVSAAAESLLRHAQDNPDVAFEHWDTAMECLKHALGLPTECGGNKNDIAGFDQRAFELQSQLPLAAPNNPNHALATPLGLAGFDKRKPPPQPITGVLQPIAAKILMKILYGARMARFDLLRAVCQLGDGNVEVPQK